MKRNTLLTIIVIVFILLYSILGFFIFKDSFKPSENKLEIKILGVNKTIEVFSSYVEDGYYATYGGKDITDLVKVTSNVDTSKVGVYKVEYRIEYKGLNVFAERIVEVVDTTAPVIELLGKKDVTLEVGNIFNDNGFKAIDSFDGDLSSNVDVVSNVDRFNPGDYTIEYKVSDSSGNTSSIKRNVKYVLTDKAEKIAVLNYHFFFADGETCDETICENVKHFEEQLQYLKNNNYKTLTIEEFRKWMYGEIELPRKSVLITVDDGAMGTGKHNGNKLIPLLEKYDMHAVLFLITGWWDIENYRSPNLDIQSHSNDMHNVISCGTQLTCEPYEKILSDLKKSAEVVEDKTAFCYPFYSYNDKTIKAVKEVGFKMAFAGANRKASRKDSLYGIPRYVIFDYLTMDKFISYVS